MWVRKDHVSAADTVDSDMSGTPPAPLSVWSVESLRHSRESIERLWDHLRPAWSAESLVTGASVLGLLSDLAGANDIPPPARDPTVPEATVDELVADVTEVLEKHRSNPVSWSL